MNKTLPIILFVTTALALPLYGITDCSHDTFEPTYFLEEWFSPKTKAPCFSYRRPDYVPIHVWEAVESKLLPEDHPIKRKLDKIFSKTDVNKNGQTLAKAGFRYAPVRSPLNAVVARHPKLKGYLIKTFTDEQPYTNEWSNWLDRIRGVELISEMIQEKGYQKTFKAPKKWIYINPYNSENATGRAFILIVEDMELEDFEKNKKLWKKKVTTKTLDALYDLLETLGLIDSIYIDNIPFSKDGKIAFIDTEHSLRWPVAYFKLNNRLSDKNRDYWIKLTKQ